jgi:hypothetical protein
MSSHPQVATVLRGDAMRAVSRHISAIIPQTSAANRKQWGGKAMKAAPSRQATDDQAKDLILSSSSQAPSWGR